MNELPTELQNIIKLYAMPTHPCKKEILNYNFMVYSFYHYKANGYDQIIDARQPSELIGIKYINNIRKKIHISENDTDYIYYSQLNNLSIPYNFITREGIIIIECVIKRWDFSLSYKLNKQLIGSKYYELYNCG